MSLTTFKILGVESYSLPRLNQEEIENIKSTEIETMIKDLLINKSPGPDSLTGKFYQTFREELTPVLLKLFQKVADEGKFLNSFYEATITMIPKPDKDTIKKKKKGNHRPLSMMDIDAKILNKILAIHIQQYIKRIIYPP